MHRWVRSAAELEDAVARLRTGALLALDSESDSLHHHVEKVCLIQLAAENGDVFLVDPLAFKDLQALGPILADPGVVKLLHGADYDVTTLKRDFGFEFVNVFDTMIAARFLARPEIGLQALALSELGVTLDKGSQRDDWSRRPLTPRQEAYAAEDVRHLAALRARLEAELAACGRLAWALEECAAVAALPAAERRRDEDAFRKVKGSARLAGRALAVLRAAYLWREARALEHDIPAFKLMSGELLLHLAQAPPKSLEELRTLKGFSPRLRPRLEELFADVQAAVALRPADWPQPQRKPRPASTPAVQRRVERLRAWRTEAAAALGLDISVILPQRLIDKLAEAAPASDEALRAIPGLRAWRADTFGTALLAAVA